MILPVHTRLRSRVAAAINERYGLTGQTQPDVILQTPPTRAMGDVAVTVAFELARVARKAPRAIAQELLTAVGHIEGIATIEAAPNGYLNFFLDRPTFLVGQLTTPPAAPTSRPTAKAIVEHTAINPNKAAHIGHLRNAVLGDTLARLLRFHGIPVEIQNYIDDTGVQVADMVVAFRELESKDVNAVRRLAEQPRFDYACWDLYTRVTEWYEADATRLQIRAAALHAIEQGDNDAAKMAELIADRIVRCHLQTMAHLNIAYDLLAWEGDILRLRFWARAFELLTAAGAVFRQDTGKLAGCWVMRIDEDAGEAPDGAVPADGPSEDLADGATGGEPREKVIVRSDGTVTYVGKDIAYQFWKFGLLGKDFQYRIYERHADGRSLWATSAEPTPSDVSPPPFGGAETVYNVIDTRQAYLQKLLAQSLRAMQHTEQADRSIHFSYEMVTLSHRAARTLGYDVGADADRPFVEVSGRKGLGVKADDLMDRLTGSAWTEVATRNPELSAAECRRIAEMIAVAAVRYFMIKYSRGKVIVFDIEEALSFEGESGPYLQYAVVRANNIFRKLRERTGVEERDIIDTLGSTPATCLERGDGDDLWGLIMESARLDDVVGQAVRTLELSILAKYAFGLAQAFNAFYHRDPILNEEQIDRQRWRAAAVIYFRAQMTRALDLMGCEVPPRM